MQKNFLTGDKTRVFKQINFLSYQVLKIDKEYKNDLFFNEMSILKNDCIYEDSNLRKGQYIIYKPQNYKIHIVRPNQTIEEIANLYNVSSSSILEKNNVKVIFTGMQLKI